MKDKIKLVHLDSLSCEAIFRIAPNGDYIIISQVGDLTEPAPLNRVLLVRSTDGGNTWSKGESIYPEDGRAVYLTEVAVDEKSIYVFIQAHNGGFLDWDCMVLRSDDSGNTWVNLGRVPCFENSFVFLRGVIKLSNGRIIIPYQNYYVSLTENEKLKREDKIICASDLEFMETGTLYSDDGVHFEKSKPINIALRTADGKKLWQWTEPTVAELSDGTLIMLMRINNSGRLWKSISNDCGVTWSAPEKTFIPNPNNKPKLIKMKDGRIILLNTPNEKSGFRYRFPLEVWISNDDLKSFYYKHTVADMPGAYSYLDGIFDEKNEAVLFAFEFNYYDSKNCHCFAFFSFRIKKRI